MSCQRFVSSVVVFFVILIAGSQSAEAVGYPFSDDFESGMTDWTAEAPWGQTTAFYSSPAHSATDSPSTFYTPSTDASLSLATSLDLTTATSPVLRFRHRHQFEDGHDFGYVETSTDGGASWSAPLTAYSGGLGSWAREQIDLSSVAGYNDVRIRFRIVTDATVNADGWYIDDILIAEGPAPVTLATPSAITPNSVDLSWTASGEPGFLAYRIYRGASSGFDWNSATLVTEITTIGTTTHTDLTVVPKTTYYYTIMVVTSDELHSLSNEESAATPAGMDYPFLDNGEGGNTAWTADPPWALTTETAVSGTHSWSDSPGGDYGNSIPSQSLTLVGPIDLTAATAPVLSFVHTWDFLSGDSANVEISTDGGSSWTPLATYTNGSSGGWLRERFELDAYTISNNVFVRFRITTDSSTGADGWHVDDISVAESPTVVDPPILDQVTSHSIRLTWARCNDVLFSHYAVYRSTATGVGIQSTLVAQITDQDTTTVTDTGLALDTDYFYRVYAVSSYGAHSPDSASESTARTGGNPYPFSDDFEGSLDNWNLTGDWATTDADQHGGVRSLTDSPSTTYSNGSNTSVLTTIDLTSSIWPVLRFWDRFAFADSGDWGWIEISPNGSSWTRIYAVTTTRTTWTENAIDLSPWKTEANLRIRFTVATGGTGTDDGWYIDDVSVAEHSGAIVPPFLDGFESGGSDWLPGGWILSSDSPYAGSWSAHSTPQGTVLSNTEHVLELGGDLDLTSAVDPQLIYRARGQIAYRGYFNAQVSTNDGVTWSNLSGTSLGNGWIQDWTRFQVPLATWAGDTIRLRFRVNHSSSAGPTSIFIDDVTIEDQPEAVVLATPVPHLKSVDLTWTQSTLGDFDRYEVYRATHSNPTPADDLVATFTSITDTAVTDTGLSIGATYHYRVYTFNTRGVSAPSNERETTTVPIGLPFVDPMENTDNWDTNGTWGPDGTTPYAGSYSINDSPGGNSLTSNTTWVLTAVDLSGSSWPVLSFWDRLGLADDWGYLQVSSNGSTWYNLYNATGSRFAWAKQTVDLSPWKNETNVRIRFTVATGGSNADEGWYIDELSVTDHSATVAVPFFDDFEAGTGNWHVASWAPSPTAPHGGLLSARSTPQGSMLGSSEHIMELAGELDLSAAVSPQLTYWIRGAIAYRGGFNVQVSTDGGLTWPNLPNVGLGQYWSQGWTRFQAPLDDYLSSGVRIRFRTNHGSSGGATDLFIDDVAIEEMPQAVTLTSPTPHLKSVDLTWSQSTLPDFNRYEVYRSTTSGVTTDDTLIATFTNNTETAVTDNGLSIGATYYYKVFTFNTRDVAAPSNERTTTTVPLAFPFVDPMEDLTSWDTDGSWGPDGYDPYAGSFSINDSPGGNSPINSTTHILTAINLVGSSWPVLRFRDRQGLSDDWGFVQVSTNGSTWGTVYSTLGSRPTWALQAIDLSPWKNQPNLRIRFMVSTNGANVDEGWYIDDLSITEHTGAISLPFLDEFEGGMDNWLAAAWAPSTDDPHGGTTSVQSTPQGSMAGNTEHVMELAGELDLSGATNPQLTYWIRGSVAYRGGFNVQVSTDGGLTWSNLPNVGLGQYWSQGWTRFQAPLDTYLSSGVRIRFRTNHGSSGGPTDLFIDDVSIEEMPQPVTLNTPDQISVSTMRLTWNNLTSPDFAAYAIYRSETSTVDTGSTLVTTITDQTTTEFTDTGLQARRTYYYRLYFVDTTTTHSPSNSTSAVTLGAPVPFSDDFEADSGVWTFTGDWGPVIAGGVAGTTSLGDSPGDLTQSQTTYAVTGVDLSGTAWPVLSFSERFDFGDHWGYVEISSDEGLSWTYVAGVTSDQLGWIHRRFDLSPWRDQPIVWIRFGVYANSATPADGWHIDDLFIGENPFAGTPATEFFDGFEGGDSEWLNGQWSLTTDDPYAGSTAILDTPANRAGGTELWFTYGHEIDLSSATDPLLTIQIRGNLPYRNHFRTEVSTDGGLIWQNLSDFDLNYYWSSASWIRLQTSLSGYLVPNLRVRFRTFGTSGGDENIFLDNISIGEQTPGAPTLNAPAWGADEPTVRPTLVVDNAVDYQSDPMTYEYQVFDDSGLTNVVAQVPAVAGGIDTSSWTVDVDLLPDTQYWWRCRATDDSAHTGDWMTTATFFVQLTDHPPTVPVLLSPADGSELPDLSGRLTWLESTDPDSDNGDYVASYRVQVDEDPAFGSPEIDAPGISDLPEAAGALSVTLGELPGSGALVTETLYHWRVNAKDSHGVASDWSAGPARFVFGTDDTEPTCTIVSPVDDATLTGTPISISGTADDNLSGIDTVEVSTDGGATWLQAVGRESWSHQWWPALSGDYQLSCRSTDVAGNPGAASTPITVHAELDRTMAFTEATATVDEAGGTINVAVTLSAARATEVNADLVISGSAVSGSDFGALPAKVRFFPGQTSLSFPVEILEDSRLEGDETIVIELSNANLPDVTFGINPILTITIVDNDLPTIFIDGFENGDLSSWSTSNP